MNSDLIQDTDVLQEFARTAVVGECKKGFFITHARAINDITAGVLYLRKTGQVCRGSGLSEPEDRNGFWPNRYEARAARITLRKSMGLREGRA